MAELLEIVAQDDQTIVVTIETLTIPQCKRPVNPSSKVIQ
jgi:hypothetical protein